MLRRHPDGWGPLRQALFALVPVVLGAAVVLSSGDEATTGINRIDATRSTVAPALERQAMTPSPTEVPAAATADPVLVPDAAGTSSPATDSVPSFSTSTVPSAATVVVAGEAATPTAAAATADAGPAPSTTVAAPASDATVPTTAPPPTTTTTTTAPAPPPTGRTANPAAAAEVVPLTNADRTAAGLGTLSRSSCLDSVASDLAEQMARSGVLAHNPGAGAGVLGCRPGATWGDNVGRAVPCDTARLQREWMASPGHRRNILTGAFASMGVGAWTGDDGTCWVQVLFSS